MPLSSCPRCKRMYNKVDVAVCPQCVADEEADYAKVREIVEREPNLNMDRAAEMSGVDVGVVARMLEKGVISRVDPNEKVTCGKCGAPAISASKRLCQACLDRLNLEVAQAQMSLRKETEPEILERISSKMNVRRKLDERWR